ncbi:putative tRNA-dihydrouridine synthase 4 [Trypanosoma grayi]|uniref:putative tRNA-dihydrouridine synthase 4 n=1 Tax=Trypanosoma grayi TaxID=71804 RepID=UPI0004F45D7C|nr:putative tRNA-dihydrouridine synthase 4 [Trypanosoma grayi]KEG13136.1 putative tRNA-dihydrouridine synthase 4 [Trypanosoma grayi]
MEELYSQEKALQLAAQEGGPTYAHTDLEALLRGAQLKTIRFAEENRDIIAAGAFNTVTPSEKESCLQILERAYHDIMKVQAPMVRCSRPAFRKLCRLWGTDISYTHMIMADSFTRSDAARHADFSMYSGENRLVSQIASCSGPVAAEAAVLLAPYCDAIDINCGCPQRWAMKEGLGSALLKKPELVADMVRCIRNGLSSGVNIPCVVKMRVSDDLERSVDFARQCEAAGAGWLTVHGRTPLCTSHAPVRLDAIRIIRESVSVPIVANGGVHNPQTALETALSTGVGGVMSGLGLLANPACFYLQHDGEPLHFSPRGRPLDIALEACTGPRAVAYRTESVAADGNCPVRLQGLPCCPVEVISDFIRLSCVTDLASKATSMHLLKMGGNYLSPAERVFVAQMHSSFSVISAFQQFGLYREEGKFFHVNSGEGLA